MKQITFLFLMLIGFIGWSQSMPIDFEVAEDDAWGAFNGTVATVITDPTDASNTVLEMVGAGVDFDGAALTLDTFVDLSDDNNNTVSIRINAPDATTRTHLLKFEGGSSGATELTFTTNMMGWQTVNVDFGPGLGTEYPIIVLFTDSTPGNTATGTYLIDDITAPNGAVIPTTPTPAGPAPDPTAPAAEVLSIYTDTGGYTNNWVADYSFGTVTPINLATSGTNEALQYNLAAAGWGQGTNGVTDISAYNFLQFDYWADSNSSEIRFFLIDNNGAVVEYWYEIGGVAPQEAIVNGAWTHVEIPLSFFENSAPNNQAGTGGFSKANFFQWKIDASSNLQSDFVYIDNIYFSQNALGNNPTGPMTAAPDPTAPANEVISMFSNVYTDVPVDTWNTSWSQSTFADIQIVGNDTKLYTNLNFNGVETVANPIDASGAGMMYFNMDVWTPDATEFRVKLVDFLGDGFQGTNGDTEAELIFTPMQGQWETISIPLADFTAAGMTSFSDINQLVIAAQPAGAATIYIDNVYYSQNPTSVPTSPMTAAPTPTAAAADVISMFSNAYTDVPVDTWNTSWSHATLADIQIMGDDTKLYTNLNFNGVETVANPIDATAANMMYFNMDIWTADATEFRVKLVDFLGDGFQGTNGDTEAELTFTPAQGQWVTLSMPLSDFTAAGMTAFSDINQLVIAAQPAGAATVYVDNVYFSTMQVASNDDVDAFTFDVYPNPAVNSWNIRANNATIDVVTIYDITGQVISTKQVNDFDTTIDASGLSTGMYIAQIVSGTTVKSVKLIKQ